MIRFKADKEYVLEYRFKSIRQLEAAAGKSISELLSNKMGFETMGLFIWAGLLVHNKDISVEQVDDIIDKYLDEGNDFSSLMEMATQAFEDAGFGAKKKKKTTETVTSVK